MILRGENIFYAENFSVCDIIFSLLSWRFLWNQFLFVRGLCG